MILAKFFVSGIPKPGGSKTAFPIRGKDGKMHVIVTDASKNKNWRSDVKSACLRVWDREPTIQPLSLKVCFYMPYLKAHYRTGKHKEELKPSAPIWPKTKPDLTKLLRSTEDALTGVLWVDDAQIVKMEMEKRYSKRPGADIEIYAA
jgi:Holliday junction resolvase RusA-like endonuclease